MLVAQLHVACKVDAGMFAGARVCVTECIRRLIEAVWRPGLVARCRWQPRKIAEGIHEPHSKWNETPKCENKFFILSIA